MRTISRLAMGLGFTAMGALALPAAAHATFPGRDGMIAVTHGGIEVIDPVSGFRRNLRASGSDPAWSPDGRRIAFVDGEWGAQDVFVMDADGSNARRVRELPGEELNPAWSPDGTRLAFVTRPANDEQPVLAVMAADGTGEVQVVALGATGPSWSPDGRRLAFVARENPPWWWPEARLWTSAVDGSDRRLVVDWSADGDGYWPERPDWSPDGHQLLYHWYVNASACEVCNELYRVNADGSGAAPTGASFSFGSAWSPQGGQMVTAQWNGLFTLDLRSGALDPVVSVPDGFFPFYGASWQPLENLVRNASFEFDLAGWEAGGGSLTRVAAADAPDGAQVARVARSGSATSYSAADSAGASTVANTSYVATVYVKAASASTVGKPVTVQLRERAPSGTVVRETTGASTSLASRYKRLTVTAAASGGGNRLAVRVRQANAAAGDALFLDQATLARTRRVMGAESPGSVWTVSAAGYKRASQFELLQPADIVRLRVYLDGKGTTRTGSQAVRGVVYADANGEPGARLATTSQVTIPAGRAAGWVDLALPSAVALRAGNYWLAVQTGSTANIVRYAATSRPGALRWHEDSYGDGAADPFGAADVDNKELSIQAIGG